MVTMKGNKENSFSFLETGSNRLNRKCFLEKRNLARKVSVFASRLLKSKLIKGQTRSKISFCLAIFLALISLDLIILYELDFQNVYSEINENEMQ